MQANSVKKILFVITKGNWGGAQRYVFDLATNLPKDKFEVAVALGQPGKLSEELKKQGVKIHIINSFQRDISFGLDWKSLNELISLFKKERPDIIHLNSSKAGGLGTVAGRLSGVKKIIFTAHGWPFWENRTIIAKSIIWFFSWLTSLLSHKTITISDYDLKVAQSMPFVGKKAVRIYNGIKPENLESGEIIRKAFPAGAKITGTIGELNRNKNQKVLLEQAYKTPDTYVAIVGEGEERKNLEDKIKEYHLEDRVKLFGFLPSSLVLKGFDRFVLPSIKEGLPYVLLEAKQAGLPIEANRVGGVSEILDKNINEFTLERMIKETADIYSSATI